MNQKVNIEAVKTKLSLQLKKLNTHNQTIIKNYIKKSSVYSQQFASSSLNANEQMFNDTDFLSKEVFVSQKQDLPISSYEGIKQNSNRIEQSMSHLNETTQQKQLSNQTEVQIRSNINTLVPMQNQLRLKKKSEKLKNLDAEVAIQLHNHNQPLQQSNIIPQQNLNKCEYRKNSESVLTLYQKFVGIRKKSQHYNRIKAQTNSIPNISSKIRHKGKQYSLHYRNIKFKTSEGSSSFQSKSNSVLQTNKNMVDWAKKQKAEFSSHQSFSCSKEKYEIQENNIRLKGIRENKLNFKLNKPLKPLKQRIKEQIGLPPICSKNNSTLCTSQFISSHIKKGKIEQNTPEQGAIRIQAIPLQYMKSELVNMNYSGLFLRHHKLQSLNC